MQLEGPGFAIAGERISLACQITAPDGATNLSLTITAAYRCDQPRLSMWHLLHATLHGCNYVTAERCTCGHRRTVIP